MKRFFASSILLCLLALVPAVLLASDPAEPGTPTQPEFELKDTTGKSHALADYRGSIVVVHFQGVQCPWEKAYQPILNTIANKYNGTTEVDGKKVPQVQFLGINANSTESIDEINQAIEQRQIPYPVLKDHGNKVADMLVAKTTPHLFIFDSEGRLVYKGAPEKPPASPRGAGQSEEQYLAPVLDALLAGEPVPVSETKSKGCGIKRE